jgi:hypothetical protein
MKKTSQFRNKELVTKRFGTYQESLNCTKKREVPKSAIRKRIRTKHLPIKEK